MDLISDVVELLARLRGECGIAHGENLVFPNADRASFLMPTVVLRRHLYPAMAHAGVQRVGPTLEKRPSTVLAYVHQARARERRTDHVAVPTSRALVLGRWRPTSTATGSGPSAASKPPRDGGRISRVMRMRTRPALHRGAGTLTAREERPLCRHFSSGPGRSRTCDHGIKPAEQAAAQLLTTERSSKSGDSLLRRN
jgi:hypothetical protein